jgi:hypothetical protein
MHLKGDFTMKETQQAMSCAWCLEEQGEVPEEDVSHGICQPHADQLLLDYYWQKLQSVPSYVETQAALFAQEEDDE